MKRYVHLLYTLLPLFANHYHPNVLLFAHLREVLGERLDDILKLGLQLFVKRSLLVNL